MNEVTAKNEIVVYQPDETLRLDVQVERDTVWLTVLQMCQLFGRERSVIAKHLNAAIQEGELDAGINVQNLHKTRSSPIAERTTVFSSSIRQSTTSARRSKTSANLSSPSPSSSPRQQRSSRNCRKRKRVAHLSNPHAEAVKAEK